MQERGPIENQPEPKTPEEVYKDFYVRMEENLLNGYLDFVRDLRIALPNNPFTRDIEVGNTVHEYLIDHFSDTDRLESMMDMIMEDAIVDSKGVKTDCINNTIAWWNGKIEEPDRTIEQVDLGKQRIAHFEERLSE